MGNNGCGYFKTTVSVKRLTEAVGPTPSVNGPINHDPWSEAVASAHLRKWKTSASKKNSVVVRVYHTIHLAKGLGRKYCHRDLNLANNPHSQTLSKFWIFLKNSSTRRGWRYARIPRPPDHFIFQTFSHVLFFYNWSRPIRLLFLCVYYSSKHIF